MGKPETADWFFFGEARERIFLVGTGGKTIPYKNHDIPRILRKPLKVSEEGSIEGWKSRAWKSGGRSAILNFEGKWFDIEGVRPSEKEWTSGIPRGGDTRKEAENELNLGDLFYQYGQEEGLSALMKPVCLFEYNLKFQGESVCAPVLETLGDLRLSHFLGDYLTAAARAYNQLRNSPSRKAEIDRITEKMKESLTNRIGAWVGFWYRCLDKNGLLWGTTHVKNPDGTYSVNSNAGNNNLAAYRVGDEAAIGIVDLDSCSSSDPTAKTVELDRIRKRLSIYEMTLHLLEHGTSAVNISQYQIVQTLGSRLYEQIAPPKGVNYYEEVGYGDPFEKIELPKLEELEIIRCFEEGRRGVKPELIRGEYVADIDAAFRNLRTT